MTVPSPPMTLTGHCSSIYNDTLYVYTSDGFASIALEQNATWNKDLPHGVSVSGAACVSAAVEGDNDDMALYVVGGTGNSSYSGLQRFSYQHQNWTTLPSDSDQLPNRTAHGVGYMESSGTMLMYGGSVDSDQPSQETYLISTTWPYDVTSKPAQAAPAASNPMLLKWNESTVALIGGSPLNTDIYIFSGDSGFVSSGAVLQTAVSSTSRCALAIDDDGNKILEEFDLSSSPNTVTSYKLIEEGNAMNPATLANGTSSSKRSLSNYPAYNSTDAPTTKRSDYSVTQGSNGMIVISGGSGSNSLSIFNQTTNSWGNATELFYGSGTQSALHGSTTSSTTSTTSTTPTATSSASATSTSAAAGSGGSGVDVGVIIGATLGSICGAIVILVAILFMLRRARLRREQPGQTRGGDGKDRLSFQDQGIEPLTEGAYPMAKSPVPGAAAASNDSLAIMSGKYGYSGEKSLRPPSKNYGYGLSKNSPLSTIPSSGMAPSSMYSDDSDRSAAVAAAVEAISSPGNKPGDRTTDEGWGKYFDNNNATNLAGTQSDRSTISSVYTKSDYRGSGGWPMANLAPMNFGYLDQPKPLGRVPATETAGTTSRNLIIPESQSARISSADSISLISDDDPHDTNWTGAGHSSWLGRPTSSNYSTSFYNTSNTNIPISNSNPNPHSNTQSGYARYSGARRSSVIIPEDIDELPPHGTMNSDMSWLNLHADR